MQLFNLRAPSSTYVPVLLLNQPNNVGVSSFLTPLAGVFLLKGSPSLQCLVSTSGSWYGQTSTNGHLSTTAIFLVDSSYIHSCSNLSGMLNFFCLQGGRCREVQLYLTFKLLNLPEYNVKNYVDPPPWIGDFVFKWGYITSYRLYTPYRQEIVSAGWLWRIMLGFGANQKRLDNLNN